MAFGRFYLSTDLTDWPEVVEGKYAVDTVSLEGCPRRQQVWSASQCLGPSQGHGPAGTANSAARVWGQGFPVFFESNFNQ